MGTDKARLTWQGRTLLEWQKARLADSDWAVFHSGPDGIVDLVSDFPGPLGGLQAALLAEPEVENWVLVPVDMPAIGLSSLKRLAAEAGRCQAPVAYRDCPLPMAVPVLDSLAVTLNQWLTDPEGPRSLFRLHQRFQGQWLSPPPESGELVNLNTPEDWHWFQHQAGYPAGENHE